MHAGVARRRTAGLTLAIIAGLILLGSWFVHAPAAAAQQDDGLEVVASTTYTPLPAEQRIEVTSTYEITNRQPDEVIGDSVRSYFYTKWVIAMPATAEAFVATSDGLRLATTTEPADGSDDVVFASISFPSNLDFDEQVTIDVSYMVPGGEPRAGAVARVNSSFLSFSVWTVGDPGTTDVTIVVPDGFTMETQGDLDELVVVTRDGTSYLEAIGISEPQAFFGQVFGRNDRGLITEEADLPRGTAVVRAWPDDPDWANFVVETIETDVPILEELTGLTWPDGDLQVIESVTPYLYGYGGWFNATSGVIEVGENLERDLILHELGHVLFNNDLIEGRWITEGLAEEYASRVIGETSASLPSPETPDLDDPVRVPLAEWASPWTLEEDRAFAYEQYHYNAAWWVTRQLTEEVGLEAFSDVLVALAEDRHPYPGGGPIETTTLGTRWTHLFDLLEFEAGADPVVLDTLFGHYVLGAEAAADLAVRRTLLNAYRDLNEAGAGWAPPVAVRRALAQWNFDEADLLITEAAAALAARDRADDLARAMDISIDHQAELAYEDATGVEALESVEMTERSRVLALEELAGDRADLVEAANDLGAEVEFVTGTSTDVLADLLRQRLAIEELRQARSDIATRVDELDLNQPDPPEQALLVDQALRLAQARLATLDAIARTTAAIDAPRGLLATIGLWRDDPAEHLAAARLAFGDDQLDQALASTSTADQLLADAADRGRSRLGWSIAVLGIVVLGVVFGLTRGRRLSR